MVILWHGAVVQRCTVGCVALQDIFLKLVCVFSLVDCVLLAGDWIIYIPDMGISAGPDTKKLCKLTLVMCILVLAAG